MSTKKNLQYYLNNVLGEEGLKTDIRITVSDATLRKTSLYAVGTAFLITVMVFGIRGVVNSMAKNMEKINQLKNAA